MGVVGVVSVDFLTPIHNKQVPILFFFFYLTLTFIINSKIAFEFMQLLIYMGTSVLDLCINI